MKKLLLLLAFFSPFFVFSQHLEIIEVDTSNYPLVSAKFIALDSTMNIIKDLTIDESQILENGIEQKIVRIKNPQDTNLSQSVVLVVDVSGSMSGTNIDLAQKAIREFINLTPFTFAELSIVSFDTDLYVNQDFTRNKNKLLNSINRLRAGGGTSYEAALLSNKNSALNLTSKRPNSQPIIIFLTDGLSSVNYNQVADIANDQGAKIYTITLNMPMPHDLAEITLQTNATYYENISTVDEAKKAYLSILFQIYKLYGVVYWEAERACEDLINFEFNTRNGLTASYFYEIDQFQTKGIFFNKQIVAFDPYASAMNKKVLIGANSPATITNIKVNDSVNFQAFYDFELPYEITPGEALPLTIYRPNNQDEIYTEIEVSTDVCPPKKFYAFQGNIANFVIPGNLQVLAPNGGETFFSGQSTNVQWRNKTNNKFVNIYLSTDRGNEYTWLSQTTNNSYNWMVPGTPSSECLIKVSLKTDPMSLYSNYDMINQIKVSKNGSKFVYSSRSGLIYGSTTSGGRVKSLNFKRQIKNFELNDNNDDAIVDLGKTIYLYNSTRDKKFKIKHKKEKAVDYFYSADGKSVYVFYKNNKFVYEFNTNNGRKVKKYKLPGNIDKVSFNEGTASILTRDKRWFIWDANSKEVVFEQKNKFGFYETDVNYNGDFAVVVDKRKNIIYWSKAENDTIISVNHLSTNKPDLVKFNPKNNTLLVYSKNKDITYYAVEKLLFQYAPPRNISINSIDFNPTGNELIYGVSDRNSNLSYIYRYDLFTSTTNSSKNNVAFNKTLKDFSFNEFGNVGAFRLNRGFEIILFSAENNSTNDVSDSLFTIKTYTPVIKDTIRLPNVYVGSESTHLDNEVFFNPNQFPAVVDFIDFFNDDASKFGLVSGVPPIGIMANSNAGVEFSFTAARTEGTYKTNMVAFCGDDTLYSVVIVKAIKQPVSYTGARVDLGTVNMTATINYNDNLFKNITDSTLIIDSISNWGPDYNQISLNNNLVGYELKPNEQIPFDFSFTGKNRGATNAVFLIYLNGMPEPLRLNVSGKVYAPYSIAVKCKVTSSLDNSPISVPISYYNSVNNKFISTTRTNGNGEVTLNLPNELAYKLVTVGVNKDSAFVDLTEIFVDTVIYVNMSVLEIEDGMKYNLQNANFDIASANLHSDTKHELDKLVKLMKAHPEISILVDGHTDDEGNDSYNLDLSERRAGSVKNYLVSKGISASRISTKGYGATKPITTNTTDDGKAQNRRIEITINTK